LLTESECRRAAHFRTFRLPGGSQAVKEPRRSALGMLYEALGENELETCGLAPVKSFAASELKSLKGMLQSGFNSPLTSSVGRLFDGVASLLGIRQIVRYEGQAAMELEFVMGGIKTDETYSFALKETTGAGSMLIVDWSTLVQDILADLKRKLPVGLISAKFHNTLAEIIVATARRVGQSQVALSGGCFQNRYLTERVAVRLEQEGFRPYWHQRIPPNDGGIALGQIIAALMIPPAV
jgi:hydrogenase maturation protein HypF